MSSATTTSLMLPAELKSRVAAAAERAEQSAHAFMLEAIARQVEHIESEAAFLQAAMDSLAEVEVEGTTFDATEVHAWLLAKVRGESPAKPRPVRPRARPRAGTRR